MVEQQAVVHLELGTAADDLAFQLELDNRYRLIHLRDQADRLFIERGVGCIRLRHEQVARIIAVHIHCERGQRKEVDAVAVFQRRQITETQAHTDHIGNTSQVTGSRSHPQHIVVAPLDIEMVVIAKGIHDDMGTRATIVDIAYHVQCIDRQTLYQVTHGDNEILCPPCGYDRLNNLIQIGRFIRFIRRLVQ